MPDRGHAPSRCRAAIADCFQRLVAPGTGGRCAVAPDQVTSAALARLRPARPALGPVAVGIPPAPGPPPPVVSHGSRQGRSPGRRRRDTWRGGGVDRSPPIALEGWAWRVGESGRGGGAGGAGQSLTACARIDEEGGMPGRGPEPSRVPPGPGGGHAEPLNGALEAREASRGERKPRPRGKI
jgi:hypothetical protein